MKIIDLSRAIVDSLPVDPPFQIPKIDYITHYDEMSLNFILQWFPGVKIDEIPGKCHGANEFMTISTHSGTHMDAPFHFHPTMNYGEPAWTIDEVPLEWCMGDGVMIDFTDKPDGYVCKSDDFKRYLERVDYILKPNDIVIIQTTAQQAWGTPDYLLKGCGVGREGTLWLIDQGVHLVGTDAWSWDAPMALTAKKYAETKDPSIIWEGHKAGLEKAYCQMEKLCNLDKLPPNGFKVIALPVKIERAGAGWTRAIAIIED